MQQNLPFKSRAEAEAGDEAIETVGVEEIGGNREVLLEIQHRFGSFPVSVKNVF